MIVIYEISQTSQVYGSGMMHIAGQSGGVGCNSYGICITDKRNRSSFWKYVQKLLKKFWILKKKKSVVENDFVRPIIIVFTTIFLACIECMVYKELKWLNLEMYILIQQSFGMDSLLEQNSHVLGSGSVDILWSWVLVPPWSLFQ